MNKDQLAFLTIIVLIISVLLLWWAAMLGDDKAKSAAHDIKKFPYIINDASGQHYVNDFDIVDTTLTYVDEEGSVKMDKSLIGVTITFRDQHSLDDDNGIK